MEYLLTNTRYILGNVYPLTMPGPPGELMAREKIISREWHQRSAPLWAFDKTFLESEFQHKENKQTEKRKFSANLAVFLAATDLESKIIQILDRKGQIKHWTELSSLEQELTFKSLWDEKTKALIVKWPRSRDQDGQHGHVC